MAPYKQRLEEIEKSTTQKVKAKAKKEIVYNNAKRLYSILLSIYNNNYNDITDEEKERVGKKYDPKNLVINGQSFIESKKKDEEKSKSQLEESIAKRVKLR